jgi:chaperonin GroES
MGVTVGVKLEPVFNRVVVEPVIGEDKKGSIIVPEMAKEKPQEALVLAVGPEARHVSAGDRVLYAKYSGSEVIVNDVPYLILEDRDVLARIIDTETDTDGVSNGQ